MKDAVSLSGEVEHGLQVLKKEDIQLEIEMDSKFKN